MEIRVRHRGNVTGTGRVVAFINCDHHAPHQGCVVAIVAWDGGELAEEELGDLEVVQSDESFR